MRPTAKVSEADLRATDNDRRKFIGGSDAAAILGISPWSTPLDVFLQKTQPPAPVDPGRERYFTRGKRMEPYVLDLMAEETGLVIVQRNRRYRDPLAVFLAAEIDAETADANIEIKTVSPFKAKEWGEERTDEVPVHYVAQAMHGLMVTGRDLCIFGVLIGGDDFRVYRVERDDETIAAMRAKEILFWAQVQRNEPPAPTNAADVLKLFAKDAGVSIEATAEILNAYNRLRECRDIVKSQEQEIGALEETIKLFMADAATLTCCGKVLATWKSQSTNRFNQKAFSEAHSNLFNQFKEVSDHRVFRIK